MHLKIHDNQTEAQFNEDIKENYNLQQTTPYYGVQDRYIMELALVEDL